VSVNKARPHVFVLPEDDANRQIANGFQSALPFRNVRQMQILREAGGWARVRDNFLADQATDMERNTNRFMVLVIDFDENAERLESIRALIPANLRDRVYIIGSLSEPEDLPKALGSREAIGRLLAKDCAEKTNDAWGHQLLRHNAGEVERMRQALRPILFGDN
jgi:hypothetical protein